MRKFGKRVARSISSTRAFRDLRARACSVAAVGLIGLALGGCSVSYPLFNSENDDLKTGSIDGAKSNGSTATAAPADRVTSSPLAPLPGSAPAPETPGSATPAAYAPAPNAGEQPAITPSDWSYARGALSLAMGAEASNASVPWANPDSGAYGTFSASAAPTTDNGATCRAFAASHSASGHEQRLEGKACRTAAGYWEAVAIHTTASRSL